MNNTDTDTDTDTLSKKQRELIANIRNISPSLATKSERNAYIAAVVAVILNDNIDTSRNTNEVIYMFTFKRSYQGCYYWMGLQLLLAKSEELRDEH